jgi:hypothetical protein
MKQNLVIDRIRFPKFTGVKCSMMPFIQGDGSSLPAPYQSYSKIVDKLFLEKGEVGFLTIDESFVGAGKSQRGFGAADRKVHVEVGRVAKVYCWGDTGWGGSPRTILDSDTKVLISNSVSDTCRVWNEKETSYTKDGDLSEYIDKYPEQTGMLLKQGEVAKISIFTPHECVNQKRSGNRQFFRIVGKGVRGRENYFTINPLIDQKMLRAA